MARKEKKYNFIYKTTNILSGRYYIGMHSTNDLEDGYLGSGNRLRLAIIKHGKENFKREILEFCESRAELIKKEIEIVTLDELSKENCVNLRVGGEGGWFVDIHNKAFKEKLKNDASFKKKYSEVKSKSAKKAVEEGRIKTWKDNYDWTGKKHSDDTKQKMSDSAKGNGIGENNSQYGTCWVTKDGTNKKIKIEDLDRYTNDGWLKGRKVKFNDSFYKNFTLNKKQVLQIKEMLKTGDFKNKEIANKFNVAPETISKIKRNIIYK
jgi:hypothetical protein